MKKVLAVLTLFCAALFVSCRSASKTECPEVTIEDLKSMDLSNLWIGAIPYLDRVGHNDNIPVDEEYIKEHNMIKWFDRGEFLGYVGDDFTRFYIHISSVYKDVDDPLCYRMCGKVRIGDMIHYIAGALHIEDIEMLDNPMEVAGIWEGCTISGSYEFSEFQGDLWCWDLFAKDEPTLAVLSGRHYIYVCPDADKKLYYDTVSICGDGYCNNQWEGIRRDLATGVQTVCNWGAERIPNSYGFDTGTGEFIPAEEYRKNGWQSYVSWTFDDENERKQAIEEELRKWWILGI